MKTKLKNIDKGMVLRFVLILLFIVFFVLPLYIILATGLKPFGEASPAYIWQLPSQISLEGVIRAFHQLRPNLMNSLFLAIPATFISAIFGSINGYVFAQWKFKGSDIVFAFILFGMFIPYQSILIPLVNFLQEINLYNTLPGLILVHSIYGIPITTLIFRNYYSEVPQVLTEAAQVDGAGILGIYRKIFLPVSIPGFVVVVIWQFTNIWNEFLFAVTITSSPEIQPITVALVNLAGSRVVPWNAQFAGALMAALPTLIVYIIFGRYFIKGMLAGSVKG